jgi:transcriptional regulator with XRE-family HTH domain
MRLKALREERNLTQNEVATAISTNQRNIGRWEKGENEPSASFIVSLADFFEVSTDYLLGREDDFGNVIVAGSSPRDEMTADERTLLADFRTLPDGERAQALAYVEYLAEKRGAKTKKA